MIGKMHKSKWGVIGQSIRGAQHEWSDLPNQDAIRWILESGKDSPLILAVADGHGSIESFRSDIGAELAVNTSIKVVQNFLASLPKVDNLLNSKYWAEEKLSQEIVRKWRNAVADNLSVNPFRISELDKIEAARGPDKRRRVIFEPTLAYGSTVITVLVTRSFIVYLQLGDGEIVAVSETGEVTRPLPADSRLFANETTSLCTQNAWRDFRVYFQPIFDKPPALILVSTDGYPNSFCDDASFLRVGTDILEIVRTEGISVIDKNLKSWLTEASQNGSGDDVTLGIIYRMGIEKKLVLPPIQEERAKREKSDGVLEKFTRLPFEIITEEP
jgi:hypothetical protein